MVLISQGSKSNLLYGVTQVSSSRLFCLRSTLIFIEEADITQSGLQWGPKKEKLQNKKKKQSSMSSKYKKKHLSNIANKSKLRKAENIKNKMPAILALRVMLGLIHLFQLYASPIDKTILANGIV